MKNPGREQELVLNIRVHDQTVRRVSGFIVTLPGIAEHKFIVHRALKSVHKDRVDVHDKFWTVSEFKTGASVCHGKKAPSREEALALALERIDEACAVRKCTRQVLLDTSIKAHNLEPINEMDGL